MVACQYVASIKDSSLPRIPSLAGYQEGICQQETRKKSQILPTWAYIVKYDLHIKTMEGNNPVGTAWEAVYQDQREIHHPSLVCFGSSKESKESENQKISPACFPI